MDAETPPEKGRGSWDAARKYAAWPMCGGCPRAIIGPEMTDPATTERRRPRGAEATRKEDGVIEVLVEVRSGVARFGVAVRAESIERAVGLASVRYPGSEVGVLFPIDPDAFFREEPVPAVGPILPEELAG